LQNRPNGRDHGQIDVDRDNAGLCRFQQQRGSIGDF
jgi:hypothetical protein